jgi:hypothetical protein
MEYLVEAVKECTAAATGYQGFVSGQFKPLPDADTAVERSIAYIRRPEKRRTNV